MIQRQIITLLLLCLSLSIRSEIVTRIGEVRVCPGPAEIPLLVSGFQDVASLSLKINFDTATLMYHGVARHHTAFQSGVWMDNMVGSQIILSWFSLSPAQIGDHDTLAVLSLELKLGPAFLQWDTGVIGHCSYTNTVGEVLPAYFMDGVIASDFITPSPIAPFNQGNFPTDILVFLWEESGCGATYELELSTSPNFLTPSHHFEGLSFPMRIVPELKANTHYFWRVRACLTGNCSPWSAIWQFFTGAVGIQEPGPFEGIQCFPVPATDFITANMPANEPHHRYRVQVYTTGGTLVFMQTMNLNLQNQLIIPLHGFPSGYFFMNIQPLEKHKISSTYQGIFIKR